MKSLSAALLLAMLLPSCYVTRAYRFRNFYLKDIDKIPSSTIAAGTAPFYFRQGNIPPSMQSFLDSNLANSYSYAFLVIRNDSLLYEKYFDNITAKSLLPSFSVSKSFVGTLAEMALEEGHIKSFGEPITNYLPFLMKRDARFGNITIQHLLDMRSGIRSNESYSNPFSDVLKLGFTKNLMGKIRKLHIEKAPGENDYKSVNTQLLALIVEKATGRKIQDYLVEKIWKPLGMESDATWNVDSKKHQVAKVFCCINATARDYAKLGRLYLNKGNWNGQQLLSPAWVHTTTSLDTMSKYGGYKNQWWGGRNATYFKDSSSAVSYSANNPGSRIFPYTPRNSTTRYFGVNLNYAPYFAEGILEQYVFVNPKNNTIIVRLGHYWKNRSYSLENFLYKVTQGL